jgi:lipopolysaccharide export system permease protein
MFMLVMQFLWKYIDDLMGKGLEFSIILELLFYVSASLLPLALPLAILLSSLIVMGNLGEHNELTALKSSGLSIYRILKPLSVVIVCIAVGTFYFSNYIIPIANFKWHSIIWDIQETKLTSFLKPGSYTQDIDGFSIKISEGNNNSFERIVIHDRRDPSSLKTITADSGEFYRSEKGDFLFFRLHNGRIFEELSRSPELTSGVEKKSNAETYPGRKADFKTGTYKMALTGFELNRTQDDLFKNDFEMLNVFQIDETVDSLRDSYHELASNFSNNTLNKHAYVESLKYIEPRPFHQNDSMVVNDQSDSSAGKPQNVERDKQKAADSIEIQLLDTLTVNVGMVLADRDLKGIAKHAARHINNLSNTLMSQLDIEGGRKSALRKFEIEFHRKFSLSFTIIVLFFIGAPLGAIVKKGGFGAPVVIAALLFMVYFVLISIGDNMAKQDVLSPFMGMWGPTFILSPFACILMVSAANDRSVADFKILSRKKKK